MAGAGVDQEAITPLTAIATTGRAGRPDGGLMSWPLSWAGTHPLAGSTLA